MRPTNFTQPTPRTNWENGASASVWYRLYSAALLESDRNEAVVRIERAQEAIRDRRSQLDDNAARNPREAEDLSKAATYLGIMLRNVGKETERLLWD